MADIKKEKAAQAPEQTLTQNEAFVLKYKNQIIGCVAALVLIVAGVILWKSYYSAPRQEKASTEISKAQELFGYQEYETALNGDSLGTVKGFLQIANEYGSTDAGNLAKLYAGLCYAQMGQWQKAADYLKQFDTKNDQMISPAAEAALGNALAHLEKLDEAVKHLTKAAEMADNNTESPIFLIQAGEILESQGKKAEALKLYKQVKEKYFQSAQYQSIDAYIERASE